MMYVCRCVDMCACMHKPIHMHIRIPACMYVCMYNNALVCKYVCRCYLSLFPVPLGTAVIML